MRESFTRSFESAERSRLHFESLQLDLLADQGVIRTGVGRRPVHSETDGEASDDEDHDGETYVVPGQGRSQPLARCNGIRAHCGTPLLGCTGTRGRGMPV